MNKTVEVSNEIYEQLERQAQARGLTVSGTIAQLLEKVETKRREAFFEEMRAKGILLPKSRCPPSQCSRSSLSKCKASPYLSALLRSAADGDVLL